MERKDRIDLFGAAALSGFAMLLGFNQVVIKVVNDGLQPVFFAGIRSLGGALVVLVWMRLRAIPIQIPRNTVVWGLVSGVLFSVEFIFLFMALDLTTVTRTSVIFYTMPVWMALGAHVLLPGERITIVKGAGLLLAFSGVVVAMAWRGDGAGGGAGGGDGAGGAASLLGDILALGAAVTWAGTALCVRATTLRDVRPETQLLWQLLLSTPILIGIAFLFGPLLRDPGLIHWAGLAFQIVVVVSAGFLLWLWLLSIYPAAGVAAFSFLSPVFGVAFGWLFLDEAVGWSIVLALALVCAGLVLINRPAPVPPGDLQAAGRGG